MLVARLTTEGQERGEIATPGLAPEFREVPPGDITPVTLKELGLTKQALAKMRELDEAGVPQKLAAIAAAEPDTPLARKRRRMGI